MKPISTLILLLFVLYLTHSRLEALNLNQLRTTESKSSQPPIPEKVFAAEIHFSRVPHQYWEHRLLMIKGMGFNAISVYVMWNFHELEKGKFDFENGDKNLRGFMELAKKHQLMVLLRPGPYVCAEWDFGGLPVRLMSVKGLQIRANNDLFLEEVKIYFAAILPIIIDFSVTTGGPIIMLQIENEYGLFGDDVAYTPALRKIWADLNVPDIPQYYADWIETIETSHWEGANVGLNDGSEEDYWVRARKLEPKGYLIGSEIYSGWMTHWGEPWASKSNEDYIKQFEFLMSNNHSFSMYMAHGGTSFGLWSGANGFENRNLTYDYKADITSYDFDSPIDDQGSPTGKYYLFRELAQKYATWSIPEVPQALPTMTIKDFIPSAYADILLNLDPPTLKGINELVTFEDGRLKMWNQGFVLYSTNLEPGNYSINLTVHDFALVFINTQFVKYLDRSQSTYHNLSISDSRYINHLQILVEATGHVNYGPQMYTDFKGLINFQANFTPVSHEIVVDQEPMILKAKDFSWDITKIPIDDKLFTMKFKSGSAQFPRLFRYNLNLDETLDTYLNMESWGKGYVFVNGKNLGRYWNKGPQKKLFLPGVWLKKGENEVVVLELLSGKAKFISGDHGLKTSRKKQDYKENSLQKLKMI